MADDRFDEAVDIIARHAGGGWFLNPGVYPESVDKAIRARAREICPEQPTSEEFSAAFEYLKYQHKEGTTDE